MATPKKNKSGSWTAQVFSHKDANGKNVYKNITRDTKVECEYAIAEFKKNKSPVKSVKDKTVGQIVDEYIELCESQNRTEETTLSGYRKIRQHSFAGLMGLKLSELDEDKINNAIYIECQRKGVKTGRTVSPKTVINEWGLISAALRKIGKVSFEVDKPTYQPNKKFIAEPYEIIKAIKGTTVELPCLLAMWLSFTMSEVRGLTYSNIYNGLIMVNKVNVTVDNVSILKSNAKNANRKRVEKLPDYIFELIKKTDGWEDWEKNGVDGFIVDMSASCIYKRYTRLLKKNGIEMSFHDLRHEFATISSSILGIDDNTLLQDGGWNGTKVAKGTYINRLESLREQAANKRESYFEEILSNN